MFFRAMWDGKHPSGPRFADGWINTANIACVERSSRDRLGAHGQTVAKPTAIVTLTNNMTATVSGPDAVSLFRWCELQGLDARPRLPRVGEAGDLAESPGRDNGRIPLKGVTGGR